MSAPPVQSVRLIIAVLVAEILAGAELDLFVPSFPALQENFHISAFMVEWTLGINLIPYAIATFLVGHWSGRYGSRTVILYGLWFFCIGSAICIGATEFWHLLLGRFFQGCGIAAPSVLGYVVVAEHYPLSQQQRWFGIVNGTATLAMAFAPVVGSYVVWYFNWYGNFLLLGLMGLISLLFCLLWLPHFEPAMHHTQVTYRALSLSAKARHYLILIGCLEAPYWVFIGVAPILYITDGGVTLQAFGLYQGSLAAVFAIGSFFTAWITRTFGERRGLQSSLGLFCLSGLGMIGLIVSAATEPLWITGVMLLYVTSIVYPVNVLYPLALEALPHAKGKIAATISAVSLLSTALGVQIAAYFYNGTFAPIGICLFVLLIGILGAAYGVFLDYRSSAGGRAA